MIQGARIFSLPLENMFKFNFSLLCVLVYGLFSLGDYTKKERSITQKKYESFSHHLEKDMFQENFSITLSSFRDNVFSFESFTSF
jgi:hypothetical protein